MERNNTSFTVKLSHYLKSLHWPDRWNFLKYYQNVVREYITSGNPDSTGLMVYHEMGTGKSITAVAVAMELMEKTDRHVVLLLAKSLQGNMDGAIRKYVKMRRENDPSWEIGKLPPEELDSYIRKRFIFVTSNAANSYKQLVRAAIMEDGDDDVEVVTEGMLATTRLDGKILIVDEAHNLFRAITNGSKNALRIYELVMRSKDLFVLFLTGTPIAHHPFEICSAFNMITRTDTLPESYEQFATLFTNEDGTIKNRHVLANRILGLVSYVSAANLQKFVTLRIPRQLPLKIEEVPMTEEQFSAYIVARDKEKEETIHKKGSRKSGFMQIPKSLDASTYRVKTRMISTQYAGHSSKFEKILENVNTYHRDSVGIYHSQFVTNLAEFGKFLEKRGWARLGEQLPEDAAIADELASLPTVGGGEGYTYCMLTGGTPMADREKIIKRLNSKENSRGKLVALLLVSDVGSEGLDLKNVRHIHLEPEWTWGKIEQIIHRGVRNDSHVDLPPEDWTVQPYLYVATKPRNSTYGEKTTDEDLVATSMKGQSLLASYLRLLADVSIECSLYESGNCYTCKPDDRPLFTKRIDRDVTTENPCKEYKEETVKAKKIVTNYGTYYYSQDPKNALGYDIYKYDDGIGKWTIMPPSDEHYLEIIESLSGKR